MDQGVIEAFKRYYHNQLLSMLLQEGKNNGESILTAMQKSESLRDAVYMAADTWESIKQISNSPKKSSQTIPTE